MVANESHVQRHCGCPRSAPQGVARVRACTLAQTCDVAPQGLSATRLRSVHGQVHKKKVSAGVGRASLSPEQEQVGGAHPIEGHAPQSTQRACPAEACTIQGLHSVS